MLTNFENAVHFVTTNKSFHVDDEERLMIYAFYKLATVGKAPNNCPCHSWDVKGTMKYNAWKEFSLNYECEQAKELYVKLVNTLMNKYNFR